MNETNSIGDAPIEEAYRVKMNELGRMLDLYFNGEVVNHEDRETGFVLLVFPLGEKEGRCNYLSNSLRADIKVLLREQLRRFEGQPEVSGKA